LTPIQHKLVLVHTMKPCGEEEVEFCSFIRDNSWRLAVNFTSCSRFITGKRFPGTNSKFSNCYY